MSKFKKKTVVLGVTGGIAVYKSCYICSYLMKKNINVVVVMSKNATEFIAPLTFETLTGNRVYIDTFSRDFEFDVEHVSLAQKADLFLIAPATANFMAKAVNGIADDMLTTTFLAFKGKKVIAPAMNTGMYNDIATRDNMEKLAKMGCEFIDPTVGRLACGDEGIGKMQEPEVICEFILDKLCVNRDLEGKKFLITCGGTQEDIDGVRFIGNYSSGKMGVALAENVLARGGYVHLVCGNVSVDLPEANKIVKVKSTDDMFCAVMDVVDHVDAVIMAAAPCDFKVKTKFKNKIKDKNLSIEFEANKDIAKAVGEVDRGLKMVVFAAETNDLIKNATAKLKAKNADFIVANDLTAEGAGFNTDTNIVTIISRDGSMINSGLKSKDEIAGIIIDKLMGIKE